MKLRAAVKLSLLEGTHSVLSECNWKLVDLEDIQAKAILKFSELLKP
jgi:hypothetical protein